MKTGDFTTGRQIFVLSGLSLVIGALCAFIAIVLLKSIYFLTNLLFYHRISLSFSTPTHNHLGAIVILVPIAGAVAIGLIARYGSEKIRGHGIPEAIEAMLINGSKVHPKVAFWKPLSAAISIGTGGPFGAEGPIIMTGGSMGSLLSQFFHLSSIERRILLVAGAAGGMSATFAAPVSSVLFGVELLVFEFKPRSMVPIALASAIADIIRISLIGPGPLFGMPQLMHVHWRLIAVAACIGIIGSILAILLTWAIYRAEDTFKKIPIHWMWYPAIGAVVIGVGGWISPRALGVGYDSISAMLNVKLTISVLIGLLVVKTVIWVIALGSGTSGGILAPILIIGGSLGGVAGQLLHAPHPGVWALLGMSAIFSGVTRTPFTSVVFPLELTHNLGALLPLLVTASIACGISSYLLPRSILTERIARRGLHLTREYSVDPLQMHYCREFMFCPTKVFSAQATVQSIMEICSSLTESWIGVESDGTFLGAIRRTDVQKRAQEDNGGAKISNLLLSVPEIMETETMKDAVKELVQHDYPWVMVVSQERKPLGIITMTQIQEVYKRETMNEGDRERIFTIPRKLNESLPASEEA